MDWSQVLQACLDFARDHGIKVLAALGVTLCSSLLAFFWAWRSWKRRQDLDVIHYSQNTIELRPTGSEGQSERWLMLDVHSENPLSLEVTHAIPRRLIRRAAKRTTREQPFLRFPKNDRWYVLNIIRLAIAEPFVLGTAAKMAEGAKVVAVECMFAMTYERYPGMRQGKIRVMIIKRSVLDDPAAFADDLRLESPSHSDRVYTLRRMQEDYRKGEANWEYCLNVRLNVQL